MSKTLAEEAAAERRWVRVMRTVAVVAWTLGGLFTAGAVVAFAFAEPWSVIVLLGNGALCAIFGWVSWFVHARRAEAEANRWEESDRDYDYLAAR